MDNFLMYLWEHFKGLVVFLILISLVTASLYSGVGTYPFKIVFSILYAIAAVVIFFIYIDWLKIKKNGTEN